MSLFSNSGRRQAFTFDVINNNNMKSAHTISHIEIPAPDLAKAIAFYSTVFEWAIIPQGEGCAFFRIGDTNPNNHHLQLHAR
jgi:predicted enzyme related to lactoylglutathione lyase